MTKAADGDLRLFAVLGLTLATAFGVFATYVGSLAALFADSAVDSGEGGLLDRAFIVFYLALLPCPLVGWIAFALRRYRGALLISAPPLTCFLATVLWSAGRSLFT